MAVFGSDSVDVREVDKETLDFEGAGPLRFSAVFNVDRDDHDDLVARFRVSDTTLGRGRRQEVCLTGAFDDGQPFEGCNVVDVVSFPACGLGFELTLVLPLLMAMRRRSARSSATGR